MNSQLYSQIIEWLRQLIAGTKWEGTLYAVGGCCRDRLLGLEINDLDLAVAQPNGGIKFARWLQRNHHTVTPPILFKKFGTARLSLRRWPNEEIEIVQTRKEQYTRENSRCPEVAFGSIDDDCWRRDFTVNSLYYDITNGVTVDITGMGEADIRAGRLRTPLDPDETFEDDPVRILRCLRFSVRFDWEIDKPVFDALVRHVDRLQIVSRERMRSELGKMLTGPHPARMMELLRSTGALPYMLPQMQDTVGTTNPDETTVWEESMEMLRRVENLGGHDLPQRMAALFANIGKVRTRIVDKYGRVRFPRHEIVGADMTAKILRAAKFESGVIDDVVMMMRRLHDSDSWGDYGEDMTDKALRRLQFNCGDQRRFNQVLGLMTAAAMPEARITRIRRRTTEMISEGTDMFSFRLESSGERPRLESNIDKACANPQRPSSDYTPEESSAQKSEETPAPRRRRRRSRGRSRRRKSSGAAPQAEA
jgi:poly(A) polymerase